MGFLPLMDIINFIKSNYSFSSILIELPEVREKFAITIDRVEFESKLCFDLYTTLLDELEKAFHSAGLIRSQIDAVFALGESQNNHKIRKFFLQNFSGKVQFEQTDADEKLFRQLIDRDRPRAWQIFAQTLCSKTLSLNVYADDTIEHVKRLIEQKDGMALSNKSIKVNLNLFNDVQYKNMLIINLE